MPVRLDLKGWSGVHQTSLVTPTPRGPRARDVGREQEGFAERDDFRLVAHLCALIVEAREVRCEKITADDLHAGLLEGRNLRCEIVAESGKLARIHNGETGGLDRRDKRVVPVVIVLRGVEERAHYLVGILLLPETYKAGENFL